MFRYLATRAAPRVAIRSAVRAPRVSMRAFAAIGLVGAAGFSIASAMPWKPIANEGQAIEVDLAIDPFPLEMKKNDFLKTDWVLVGTGVRTVTFVSFKVYGVGIYVAKEDLPKAKQLLQGVNIDTLLDPVANVGVIDKLLDGGVKFMVRFSPVRNTDFNHLKDGYIKLILANPKAKEVREPINRGLDELRLVFQLYRGAVPKNHVLYLQQGPQGQLDFTYQNTKDDTTRHMGTVAEPQVLKVLLLSYMLWAKPLSVPLQQSVAAGLATL